MLVMTHRYQDVIPKIPIEEQLDFNIQKDDLKSFTPIDIDAEWQEFKRRCISRLA